MNLGIDILGPEVSVLTSVAAGAQCPLVDKRDSVATFASLVTSNSSIIIQRGKEKKVKSGNSQST